VSKGADIRDIDALEGLKAALGRFGEDVHQILPALQKQFEEIQAWLEERQRFWEGRVDQAQDQLHEARREMHRCHRRAEAADEDDYVDCSFEEQQVADAERELAECEDNLETVKQWRHRIESQIADFQNDMHRLSHLASERTGSAQAFLAGKIEILGCYTGGTPAPIGAGTVNVSASSVNTMVSTSKEQRTTQLPSENKNDRIHTSLEKARFGYASTTNYKKTFFTAYPYLKGQVVIHHAVPQNILKRYPGLVKPEEIHSFENLRGIPRAINDDFHASLLNSEWNHFYRENPTATKELLLEKATEIDTKYGHNFLLPIGSRHT